ncbi:MAG: DUF58 domain-containing protein [Anaerolineae bacterium]
MPDQPFPERDLWPSHSPKGAYRPASHLFDEAFLQKLERLAILSRRAMAGQLQGERRSPRRGQSVEFADFRPYAPGDDFRRIDWNAYARLERFFIKLFVEEEDLTVHLLVDASRSMNWGQPDKLWYAVRAAGALGYVALTGLDRVTVTVLNSGDDGGVGYFPPHRGKGQALALFGFLQAIERSSRLSPPPATFAAADTPPRQAGDRSVSPPPGRSLSGEPARPPTGLAPHLRAYAASATQPGPLLLFSDLLDDGWPDGLRALASRGFEITVLHILAPDEVNPEVAPWLSENLSGDFKLLDIETGAEVEITADYELLARYRHGLAAWQEELRRFCNARAIHYVPVETTLPLEELLFAWLRQRGVLR